ncbi:uncharacterized protein LOC116413596 [Galleria mellonella]|uniref:Uncharacterized protein LOC116413596 n=1 Tax=Galleria mellonella TaxID=7137 RepID=A0ABM3MH69_GALME|nr:uncharacterized protein LOC116413596 [Galleria mellonella]
MSSKRLLLLLIGWLCVYTIYCIRIIPEKAEINYFNPKFMSDVDMNVTSLAKGVYAINIHGDTKQTWANNVTLDVVVYELQGKEYKPTFIEFHFRLCDLINDDPHIGKLLSSAGFTCPLLPGKYSFKNIAIPNDDIPYPLPFQRAKGVGTVVHNPTGVVMANGSMYLHFK